MFSLSFPFYLGLPALLTALHWMEEVPELPKFLSGFEMPVLKALSGVCSSLPLPSLTLTTLTWLILNSVYFACSLLKFIHILKLC